MFPYLAMFGLPAFFALTTNRQQQAGFGMILILFIFTGLIGLRYDIGPDWFAYTMQAQALPKLSLDEMLEKGEVGWSLLAVISDEMGWGVQGLAFVSGLIFVIGVIAVARTVEEPMLAIISAVPYLCIAVAMSGMRQALAMGILFILFARWYRMPIWARIGLILFASTFHFTALALLFVVAMEANVKPIAKAAFGAIIFALVAAQVSTAEFRLERYTQTYLGEGAIDAPGAILHVALTGAPCLVYFMFRKRWIEAYGKIPLVDILAAIGSMAMLAVLFAPTATDRMTLYFSAVAMIISGNLPRLWQGSTERYAVRGALIAANFVALLVFLTLGNKANAFVPYQSIFSDAATYETRIR